MVRTWVFVCATLMPAVPSFWGATSFAHAGEVSVSQSQIDRMAIKIEAVKPTSEQSVAILPGTVIPARNARIVAPAPFGGTVTQVHVLPGESVDKGAALATVSSRELIEAASALAQSEADHQAAKATAKRRRILADKNIQNPAMAEEAEAQVAKIEAVIAEHRQMLALAGSTTSSTGSYTIMAPAAGRVVETAVMPGDKIEMMAPAVTIDTRNELWIEAQLPAHLVTQVTPGDRIQVVGGPEGIVKSVGGSLDKMTRSAKLIATVPAGSGLLPGQSVTLTIMQRAATGALSVPSSAVVRINNSDGVFVRNDGGFKLVPVEVSGRDPVSATISGDLPRGAQVAASGLPQLEQLLGAE
jgi:RND family efflux transporter MFP subunit